MKRIARIFFLGTALCLLLPVVAPARRVTVVVSFDGFRDDYTRCYSTPFLDEMARSGVTAHMQPSFPSKTFPNHYTLATGLVPDHHGIIANTFYDTASRLTFSLGDKTTKQDPRFWGGEPIWNTATQQSKRVCTVYWPGSDVCIQGTYPTEYKDYEVRPLLSFAERVAEVGRYLQLPDSLRPDLIMAYFEEPDHSGHTYGPLAPGTRRAVERMDQIAAELYATMRNAPDADSINLIVLSDHGMTATDADHFVDIGRYLDKDLTERIATDIPTLVWPRKGKAEEALAQLRRVPHARAYRKGEIPEYLHYGSHVNIAPLVLIPDMGWTIGNRPPRPGGSHGFDSSHRDMQVLFRATGPDFKKGYEKPGAFANTCVYPLLCRLLGIRPAACDGNLDDIADIMADSRRTRQ